jgi:hypothetical protein
MLPELLDWASTRDSLHRASQVLGAFRKLGVERDPKFYLHQSLQVISDGLSTGTTQLGELHLNFPAAEIEALPDHHLPLTGETQASLSQKIEELFSAAPEGMGNTEPLVVDPEQAVDYARALNFFHDVLSEFRENLPGFKTPLVVWPHHFDLSFLWFKLEDGDEHAAHVNFGFAPGGDGVSQRPYLYAYAWDGSTYAKLDVAEPLRHDPNFISGVILLYDDLLDVENPAEVVKTALESIRAAAEAHSGFSS